MAPKFRMAKVLAVHPDKHTADLMFLDTGGPFMDAFVAVDFATTNSGSVDLPDPTQLPLSQQPRASGDRDILAAVLMFGTTAIVMGFIYPQFSQLFFRDRNRRIDRHASDVYSSIDGDGNYEFAHPSGTYLRFGETPGHEDLTGKDTRGLWKIANNTGTAPYLDFALMNAGSSVATVQITPTGTCTITGHGNLSSTFQGTQVLHSTGNATVSTDGNAYIIATHDVNVTASGNLNATMVNLTMSASGNGSVTSSGTLLLSSGSTATLHGATEVMITAPIIQLTGTVDVTGAVNITGAVTVIGIVAATGFTVGGVPVLLDNQQAADSAMLGGLPAANYLTTASLAGYATTSSVSTLLAGYLQLAGGTMTGPIVLSGNPTAALHAAPKQYVDTMVPLAGGAMTGLLLLSANPTNVLGATPKQYCDLKMPKTGGLFTGNVTIVNAQAFEGQTTTGGAVILTFVDGSNNAVFGSWSNASTQFRTTDARYFRFNMNSLGDRKSVAWRDGCRVLNSANLSVATGTAFTVVSWDTDDYDDNSYHSTTTNKSRITPGVAGRGSFTANMSWGANNTGSRALSIQKNGAEVIGGAWVDGAADTNSGYATGQNVSTGIIDFTATDYFEVYVRQNSGANLNAALATQERCCFQFQMTEYL